MPPGCLPVAVDLIVGRLLFNYLCLIILHRKASCCTCVNVALSHFYEEETALCTVCHEGCVYCFSDGGMDGEKYT